MTEAYVISMERSKCRRTEFAANNSWLNYVFYDAVDARITRIPFLNVISAFFGKDDFSIGALGCLLSHRRLWRKLLKSQRNYYIIFEDDIIINKRLYELWIKELDEIIGRYDVIFLGANNTDSIPNILKIICIDFKKGMLATPIDDTLYCSYAYIVTRQGAKKLLKKTKLHYPVDYWGEFNKNGDMKYCVVYPNIVKPSSLACISEIQSNKKSVGGLQMSKYLLQCVKCNLRLFYKFTC